MAYHWIIKSRWKTDKTERGYMRIAPNATKSAETACPDSCLSLINSFQILTREKWTEDVMKLVHELLSDGHSGFTIGRRGNCLRYQGLCP